MVASDCSIILPSNREWLGALLLKSRNDSYRILGWILIAVAIFVVASAASVVKSHLWVADAYGRGQIHVSQLILVGILFIILGVILVRRN